MRAFLAALHFLTTLPLPGAHRLRDEDWGRATAWYPAAGLVLGGLLAALDWGLGHLWPAGVASALVLAAWVGLTGALHLDGWIDCCDGLLAPVSPERRLEILRDVHAGAFGVAGAVLLLLVKYAALAALPAAARLPGLIVAPVLGRWVMTLAVLLYPYARAGEGLGKKVRTGSGWKQGVTATTILVLAVALAGWMGLGWAAAALPVVAGLVALAAAHWARGRIGGLTGDVYGALCELAETVSLLAIAALAHGGLLA